MYVESDESDKEAAENACLEKKLAEEWVAYYMHSRISHIHL